MYDAAFAEVGAAARLAEAVGVRSAPNTGEAMYSTAATQVQRRLISLPRPVPTGGLSLTRCDGRRKGRSLQCPPLVPANGTRLNLYCMGSGSPAVVFDSGWEDWAPVWTIVQPKVAKWTRACSYDRAGAGFSDPGPMPRSSVRIAEELHTAFHRAGIAGPYILVGS